MSNAAPATSPVVAPRLVSPSRFILLALVAGCCGMGISAWLDGRTRPAFTGRLHAHTISVTAGRSARIVELPAASGASVSPGDTLVVVSDDRLDARIRQQEQEVKELEADVARVTAAADIELQWRQRDLQAEQFELQLKAAGFLQDKISRQVEQIAWQERLNALSSWTTTEEPGGFGKLLQASFPDDGRVQAMLREDAAATAAEALSVQLGLCEQRIAEIQALSKELESKIKVSAGVDLAQQRLTRAREELESIRQQREGLKIASPAYGIVGVPQRQPGDIIQPGETIVDLLDPERRFLVAEVPSSAAVEFHAGSKVALSFPGGERRTGVIRELPPQTDQPAARTQESFLEVRIEPAGRLWPTAPIGTRVDVSVLPADEHIR